MEPAMFKTYLLHPCLHESCETEIAVPKYTLYELGAREVGTYQIAIDKCTSLIFSYSKSGLGVVDP
jgi:hypothetical protein